MLGLESEVAQRPEFNPHCGQHFVTGILFSCSKASDANIGIIASFFVKTPNIVIIKRKGHVFWEYLRLSRKHVKANPCDCVGKYLVEDTQPVL